MKRELTMDEAGSVVMPFGEHKGRSIRAVASTWSGLEYLDWLLSRSWLTPEMREPIERYMGDPEVASELEKARPRWAMLPWARK